MGLFGFVKKRFKSSVVKTVPWSLARVLKGGLMLLERGIKSAEEGEVSFKEFIELMKTVRDMINIALGKDQA